MYGFWTHAAKLQALDGCHMKGEQKASMEMERTLNGELSPSLLLADSID
jgi:hypothetical protein